MDAMAFDILTAILFSLKVYSEYFEYVVLTGLLFIRVSTDTASTFGR